ncbi:MAG: hypothetical protein MUP98_08890 [Candidatus Aminicenantes bacterium]|nr:hypothetical protein [Candidatus Aminicenantes bacterium]
MEGKEGFVTPFKDRTNTPICQVGSLKKQDLEGLGPGFDNVNYFNNNSHYQCQAPNPHA